MFLLQPVTYISRQRRGRSQERRQAEHNDLYSGATCISHEATTTALAGFADFLGSETVNINIIIKTKVAEQATVNIDKLYAVLAEYINSNFDVNAGCSYFTVIKEWTELIHRLATLFVCHHSPFNKHLSAIDSCHQCYFSVLPPIHSAVNICLSARQSHPGWCLKRLKPKKL